jgi:hypothetical protein
MSVFRKISTIDEVNATSIGQYAGVVAGNIPIPNDKVSFIDSGYSASVMFTCLANISGVTFTVTGTYNGHLVSEQIKGPNGGIVSTDNLFDVVTSITADRNDNKAYNIGSNFYAAVVFDSYNTKNASNFNLSLYQILVNSRTTAQQWDAGNFVIYGVSGEMPRFLNATNLDYDTRSINLYPINDVTVDTTIADLQAGFIDASNYPFSGIIVYFTNGTLDAPTFVEITQR